MPWKYELLQLWVLPPNRKGAADLYEKFLLEYPLRPELESARRGLNRLRPR